MIELIEIDFTDLPTIGWITITDVGEENMYFTIDGINHFCKVDK